MCFNISRNYVEHLSSKILGWIQGGEDRGSKPLGKSQVALHLCCFRNTSTDPKGPIASRGRSVRPFVKCFGDYKQLDPTPSWRNFLDPHTFLKT